MDTPPVNPSSFQPSVVLHSPAKINLYLAVTGKRPDGYHDLNTLMCCIDLHDLIRLDFGGTGITIHCSHPDVPNDETNLAWRAAKLFFDATRHHHVIHIHIEKKIPIGAGLGGGSSNAASVLQALNGHFGNPLSRQELLALGKTIGSDVPFFILGTPAVATGIGDILTPCPHIEPFWLVLVYPSVAVSTAIVYKKLNLRLTKNKKINTQILFEQNRGREALPYLFNDLEPVAMAICPVIRDAKASLMAHHAIAALMTGSGSAVFGLFETENSAKAACDAIVSQNTRTDNAADAAPWQVYVSRIIA